MKAYRKINVGWPDIEGVRYFGVKPPKSNGANLGVHGWVDNASIIVALQGEERDNLWTRHTHLTNRAQRVATMIEKLRQGTKFPRLHLHCHGNGGTLYKVTLRDGHHQLRAYEFLGLLGCIRFKITGKKRLVCTLRAILNME